MAGERQPTDEELLARIRAGDRDAFAELYRRHEPEVRRVARSRVRPSELDDLVSESFAKVLHALSRNHGPVDQPIRYLMTAVRTTAVTMNARRSRGRQLERNAHALDEQTERPPQIGDDALVEAFGHLSPRWRRVLWWSEIEGRGAGEIAELLDISPNAASALTYRARRALREAYAAVVATDPEADQRLAASPRAPNERTRPADPTEGEDGHP